MSREPVIPLTDEEHWRLSQFAVLDSYAHLARHNIWSSCKKPLWREDSKRVRDILTRCKAVPHRKLP